LDQQRRSGFRRTLFRSHRTLKSPATELPTLVYVYACRVARCSRFTGLSSPSHSPSHSPSQRQIPRTRSLDRAALSGCPPHAHPQLGSRRMGLLPSPLSDLPNFVAAPV
jgi:hypothetical protein